MIDMPWVNHQKRNPLPADRQTPGGSHQSGQAPEAIPKPNLLILVPHPPVSGLCTLFFYSFISFFSLAPSHQYPRAIT